MLSKRVIPCLDVRAGRLTKGIKFQATWTSATRGERPPLL